MKRKSLITLLLISIVAIFFRFNELSSVPPSASLDEVSIGWNAYSILQTGKDEYGYKLPILLRAYDDWRPALYVYTVIPFIKFLGLDVVSVRLPSVIFSIITVVATYLLVKELFRKETIALFSAFFLAISPWHIYISRLGHEVNLGLSFAIFGILFFLKKRIYFSAIFFVLSFISYQTEKIFIPLLLLGVLFIFKSDILEYKRKVIIALLLSAIILTPFIKATFDPNALIRFSATNIFEANKERYIEQSKLLHKATLNNDLIGQIIYNRRILTFQIFTEGYLSHFNPVWIFTNPGGDRHKVPNQGLLYLWELPLIIIGLYALIRLKFDSKSKKIVFLWFLLAPLAASIATDTPHAMRSFVFLPTWQIFSALGAISVLNYIRRKKGINIYKLSVTLSTLVVVLSLIYLYRQYFFIFPQKQSSSFQYAISQAIPFVLQRESSYKQSFQTPVYKKVVFSNNDNLFQSYMFFLFYSRYDPELYQRQGGTSSGGYAEAHKFGKYEFRPIRILEEKRGNLYIGNFLDFPTKDKIAKSIKTLKVITNLDGEQAIKIVTK